MPKQKRKIKHENQMRGWMENYPQNHKVRIMRIRHYLKENKSTETPQDIMAIDVLTQRKNSSHAPQVWTEIFAAVSLATTRLRAGGQGKLSHKLFKVQGDLWEFCRSVASRKRRLTILGVRMSSLLGLLSAYDLLADDTLTWLLDCPDCRQLGRHCKVHRWQGYIVTNDPPFILSCRFRDGAGTLKFLDVKNFGDLTADDFGEWPHRASNILTWYCQWIDTIKRHDLGNVADTVAKQSWNSFRHTKPMPKILVHDNIKILGLEKESYYGGIVAARRIGKIGAISEQNQASDDVQRASGDSGRRDKIYYVDIVWSYPGIMRDNPYPARLYGAEEWPSVDSLQRMLSSYAVIARVHLCNVKTAYPVRRAGKTLFCRGSYGTTLAGPELARALLEGVVASCELAAYYEQEELFTAWVNRLWALRQKLKQAGDEKGEKVVKVLGNSLYGRFGMRAREWIDAPHVPSIVPFGMFTVHDANLPNPLQCRSIGSKTQIQTVRYRHAKEIDPYSGTSIDATYPVAEYAAESCPCISAYVTAYARERLYRLEQIAGYRNTYYLDTDSLLVNHTGYSNLMAAGEIGESDIGRLRLVDIFDSCEILGYKMLRRGAKMVSCGIPVGKINPDNESIEYDTRDSFDGLLRARATSYIGGRTNTVCLKTLYRHGLTRPDGWVEPFALNEP